MADAEIPTAPRQGGWRLAGSSSSYLRSAAEQAIEWYPWGSEAFEVARRTERPILLDIGASWCHWCHVMDEGTYADPEVAQLVRQHFVAVKVDRDEHPEIDRRYQRQVGALTGEGGWPLTGFLTPDGAVFLGGTYFPPTDGHGRPGFRRLLKEVARLWKEEPKTARQHASQIQDALGRMGARVGSGPANDEFVRSVRRRIHDSADPVHGGFGDAPKFPHPTAISFLLWDEFAQGIVPSGERAREALDAMAHGGVYDHIGGGFHRYSVDEGWHVPHFEKMAADNSALLSAYTEGAERFGRDAFEDTIRGIVGWVRSTLAEPGGGFGASQDADNAPGDDGGYYTWTRAQMRAFLDPEEFRLFTRVFGVGSEGRMPDDPERNVLFRLMTVPEAVEGSELSVETAERKFASAIQKVRAARTLRPAPAVDRAMYANLNGGMIRAFARAGALLGDPTIASDARRAADRFLAHAYRPERGVAHRLHGQHADGWGMLEDQVEFASALVELAGSTAEPSYAARAEELLTLTDREFRGEDGLFRDVAPALYDGAALVKDSAPSYPLEDSPHLSANAGAALAFLRFASLTHNERWREKAAALIPPIARRVGDAGLFAAGSALAAGLLATPAVSVVVEGEGPLADELERAARSTYHPNRWVFRGRPPPPFTLPAIESASTTPSRARALLCVGTSCREPITDPKTLATAVREAGRATR
jgi:hypothetical protein